MQTFIFLIVIGVTNVVVLGPKRWTRGQRKDERIESTAAHNGITLFIGNVLGTNRHLQPRRPWQSVLSRK